MQNVKGEYKAAQIQHDTSQRIWNVNDTFAIWFLSEIYSTKVFGLALASSGDIDDVSARGQRCWHFFRVSEYSLTCASLLLATEQISAFTISREQPGGPATRSSA